MIRRKWRAPALVAAAAIVAATMTACTPGGGTGSTLKRPADPVVLTGAQASALVGAAPGRVVAFRASGNSWAQIPVQVDERVATTMAGVYGLPTTQTFYGSSINVPVNVYADPNTFVGPDTNTALDADDEIAFMARDAGGPAGDRAAPGGTTGGGVEVKVNDPLDNSAVGYVYLFRSDGSLAPGAGKRYVSYTFSLNSGDYKTTYRRTDGPNPEDSTVTGTTYTAHFADRWLMDGLTLTQGSKPGVDIIDRVKYDIPIACIRNENTFDDEEGAFIVNRSGPVRALRSFVGSNSGPNTQNTFAFYDTSVDSVIDLRVHSIPQVGSHIDYDRDAVGMVLRDPVTPNGVTIDGNPDSPAATSPSWWTVTGAPGGLGFSAIYDTDATAPPVRWYEDDATPANWQCTGDGEAIGDSGASYASNIECTDPGLAGTAGCPTVKRLRSTVRIVATPASASPAEVQRQAQQRLRPLTVTVTNR
jgi:hypothetical protein